MEELMEELTSRPMAIISKKDCLPLLKASEADLLLVLQMSPKLVKEIPSKKGYAPRENMLLVCKKMYPGMSKYLVVSP